MFHSTLECIRIFNGSIPEVNNRKDFGYSCIFIVDFSRPSQLFWGIVKAPLNQISFPVTLLIIAI